MNTKPTSSLILLLLTLNVASQRFGAPFDWNYNSSYQQSKQEDLELEKAEQELEDTLKLAKSLGIETDDIDADTPDSVIDNYSDNSSDFSSDNSSDNSSGFSSDNSLGFSSDNSLGYSSDNSLGYSSDNSSGFSSDNSSGFSSGFSSDYSPYSYSSNKSPSKPQSNSNTNSFNSWNFSSPITSTSVSGSGVSTNYRKNLLSQSYTYSTPSFQTSNLNCQRSFGSGLTGFGQESDYIYFDSNSGSWKPCPTSQIPRQFNSYSNFY